MEYYADAHGHGDINFDGIINEIDYELFESHFWEHVDPNNPESVACDLNNDGEINALDFGILSMILNGYCPICQENLIQVPTITDTISNAIFIMVSMIMMMMIVRRV